MGEKGNSHWNFEKAIQDKKICATCAHGGDRFMVQGQPTANGLPIATVRICQCQQSIYYMRLGTDIASCECWRKQATKVDKPRILIPQKKIPPIKISDLKG